MDVTYLALGGRRVRAAAAHTARLAAGGTPVTLVTTARPEWDSVPIAPGVTLRRVRSPRAARPLIEAAGAVYAGDAEALAVAYATGRHDVLLEPSPDPARRTRDADLAVVTPWYPAPGDPFAGAFVQAATAAAGPGFERVSILHTQGWFYPGGRLAGRLLGVAAERQALRSGNAVVLDTAEGELTRVVAPTPAGGDYLVYADEQTRALRAALPTGRIEAPVVHAHVGFLGGVVAARLARPDARIVVTEHATFLAQAFRQPGVLRRYAEVLARADALLCVGRDLLEELAATFPEHAGRLRVVPNAIDFDRFAVRAEPPREPLRWLYLGRMMEHKGVPVLLDAFSEVAAGDPRVTLTLVGSGPLDAELDRRIAGLGLTGRVTRRPPVPPERVTALLHEHDLLVHASRRETFGMTVVEAVATGTPVLVARSAGPAETLDGIGDRAGATFEPTDDPRVVVAAYQELRARFGALDPAGARAAMLARYGAEAVRARLHEVYTEPGRPSSATVPEPVVPALRRLTSRLPSPVPEALVRTAARVARRA
ncbi:glycosyltransferase family 4 protein [Actinoplanes aureus]|uniref:Glycosyltransferase family 4 protein n=1 Tax=Actinoplanes aureus TaxID=2792083 RepID=A0A931CBA5_9ACTN|nr:glycosyltransferase family 4 protein [Actinoplanes aureus]MBG0566780.1 glycosyltransferase family 4 protein [Actinoplanes aureus]